MVQNPIFPLISIVTSVEHLSGAEAGLFFRVWNSLRNINHMFPLRCVLIIVSDLKWVILVIINELWSSDRSATGELHKDHQLRAEIDSNDISRI